MPKNAFFIQNYIVVMELMKQTRLDWNTATEALNVHKTSMTMSNSGITVFQNNMFNHLFFPRFGYLRCPGTQRQS